MKIIAGPCQHESLEQSLEIARECKRVCDNVNIEYYFKASYDKANRTSLSGARGQGMEPTLQDFLRIKNELHIKTVTDIHDASQANKIKNIPMMNSAVDVIQIPAFLCRQTDLIRAAVETGKVVNIKKGQFLAPWDVKGIIGKTEGASEVWITERGTSFGYNSLVVDFTGIDYMLSNFNCPVVFDATHSVQKPGGNGSSSGGNRDYVPGLLRAASALGVRDFFIETHADPEIAPSDGPNMLHIEDFEEVVNDIVSYSYTR